MSATEPIQASIHVVERAALALFFAAIIVCGARGASARPEPVRQSVADRVARMLEAHAAGDSTTAYEIAEGLASIPFRDQYFDVTVAVGLVYLENGKHRQAYDTLLGALSDGSQMMHDMLDAPIDDFERDIYANNFETAVRAMGTLYRRLAEDENSLRFDFASSAPLTSEAQATQYMQDQADSFFERADGIAARLHELGLDTIDEQFRVGARRAHF